jgi:hypothetical protein
MGETMRRPPLLDLELAALVGVMLIALAWCVVMLLR